MKRKNIGYALAVTGVFVFLINLLAMHMSWYWIMWWFDMPMHFLGGFFVGFLILYIWYPRIRALHANGQDGKILLFLLGGVFVIGLAWELFEFGVESIIPTIDIASPLDSLSDLFFDLAGGVFLFMQTIAPRRSRKEAHDILAS